MTECVSGDLRTEIAVKIAIELLSKPEMVPRGANVANLAVTMADELLREIRRTETKPEPGSVKVDLPSPVNS